MTKDINRLRVLRAERRLTQWDTATKAGLGRFCYWQIENNQRQANTTERKALAKALGVKVSDVFPSEASA